MAYFHLSSPSLNSLSLFFDPVVLGINLLAGSAFFSTSNCVHGEFHPAFVAGSIFFATMLPEMAPFIVSARHFVLVVETHDCVGTIFK